MPLIDTPAIAIDGVYVAYPVSTETEIFSSYIIFISIVFLATILILRIGKRVDKDVNSTK